MKNKVSDEICGIVLRFHRKYQKENKSVRIITQIETDPDIDPIENTWCVVREKQVQDTFAEDDLEKYFYESRNRFFQENEITEEDVVQSFIQSKNPKYRKYIFPMK